jgi:hypothetical protein
MQRTANARTRVGCKSRKVGGEDTRPLHCKGKGDEGGEELGRDHLPII